MRVGGNGTLTFTTSQLKTLQPGSYTLEVRPSIGTPYGPTAFSVTSNALIGDPDADRLKIDDAHQTTNDKPSTYKKGFAYELKNLGALSLDRSAYDSSAQQGTKGLLTTSVAGGSVRQRLEVLDSTRPLVFARLGAGDTWNPWELVTTWP